MGYGIITLPILFAKVGWIGATVMLMCGAIITLMTVYLLFEASEATAAKSSLGSKVSFFSIFESISPIIGDFCNISIAIYLFIATIVFIRYITNFSIFVLESLIGKKFHRLFIIIPVAIIEFVLALLPNISALSKVTYLSMASCLFVGVLCVRYSLLKPENIVFKKFDSTGITKTMGGFIFALTGQTVVPDIYQSMSHSASPIFITLAGILLGISMCLLMGLSGYFLGGENLRTYNNIVEYLCEPGTPIRKAIGKSSFDTKGYAIILATFLFMSLLICSYALLHYTGKNCLFETLNRHTTRYELNTKQYTNGLRLVSFFWINLTMVLERFCTFSVINLNGIYIGNIIGFILPSTAYILHCGKQSKILFYASILILFLGVGMICYNTYELFTS